MVRRRTHALVEFVVSTAVLIGALSIWRAGSSVAAEDEGIPVSTPQIAIGALSGGIWAWKYDRDVYHIRSSILRRLLIGVAWQLWQTAVGRLSSDSSAARYNFSIGSLMGMVGYRLWYGLLHPLPDVADGETS